MTRAFLKVSEQGGKVVVSEVKPFCSKCDKELKVKEWVFWCEISKNVFCESCFKSKSFSSFSCSIIRDDHTDWYGYIDIEIKKEVQK